MRNFMIFDKENPQTNEYTIGEGMESGFTFKI